MHLISNIHKHLYISSRVRFSDRLAIKDRLVILLRGRGARWKWCLVSHCKGSGRASSSTTHGKGHVLQMVKFGVCTRLGWQSWRLGVVKVDRHTLTTTVVHVSRGLYIEDTHGWGYRQTWFSVRTSCPFYNTRHGYSYFSIACSIISLTKKADRLGVRLKPFSLSTCVTPNLGSYPKTHSRLLFTHSQVSPGPEHGCERAGLTLGATNQSTLTFRSRRPLRLRSVLSGTIRRRLVGLYH
jgi:hypothetical protein